jgi:tetratricopeptide (TPR) repeat protein
MGGRSSRRRQISAIPWKAAAWCRGGYTESLRKTLQLARNARKARKGNRASTIWLLSALGLCSSGILLAQTKDLAFKAQQAQRAMETGNFAQAAALYTELVHDLPQNSGLHFDLGLALHSEGRYREAIRQFRVVTERQPENASAWLMLGLSEMKLGQSQDAIASLERALKIEPDNPMAQLQLGEAFLSADRPREAAEAFQKATARNPDNPRAWQGLGLSYAALARRDFQEIEKNAPQSAYHDALLAESLAGQGQYHLAFYFYRKALAAKPAGLPGIHRALAEIYRNTGHSDWAATEDERERNLPPPDCAQNPLACSFLAGRYREVITKAQNDPDPAAYYWQARACQQLSLRAFRRLAQMPESAEIHELMAEADNLQGQYHSAVAEWKKAAALSPADQRLQESLARSLWLDHDYQKALPLLKKLLGRNSESAELNFELGDTLLRLGRVRDSIAYLKRAIALSPGSLPAQASLGLAYLRNGEAAQAIPLLKAASMQANAKPILYELAEAYRQTGQKALARETMRRFAEIATPSVERAQQLARQQGITPP